MTKNVGSIDKGFRLLGAMFILTLYTTKTITGIFVFVLLGFALYMVITSVLSSCIIYKISNIDTLKKELEERQRNAKPI